MTAARWTIEEHSDGMCDVIDEADGLCVAAYLPRDIAELIASAPAVRAALHRLIHEGQAYDWHDALQPLVRQALEALGETK